MFICLFYYTMYQFVCYTFTYNFILFYSILFCCIYFILMIYYSILSQISIPQSYSEYLDQLDLLCIPSADSKSFYYSHPNIDLHRVVDPNAMDGPQGHPSILKSFDIPETYSKYQVQLQPLKYRSRIRVGRGGRMMVDRIPVFINHEYLQ